jgi:hypothetical protein
VIVKVKGIPFAFNNEETLIIPPIAIGPLHQLQSGIAEFNGNAMDLKQLGTVIDVAHAALQRNYPNLSREEVGNLVDVSNMAEVFECAMDMSGMKRKALSEGEILGN